MDFFVEQDNFDGDIFGPSIVFAANRRYGNLTVNFLSFFVELFFLKFHSTFFTMARFYKFLVQSFFLILRIVKIESNSRALLATRP